MPVDVVLRKSMALTLSSTLVLSIAACSPIEKQAVRLNSASGCCTTLEQAQLKQLDGGKENPLKLSEASPTFQFDGGKSYFGAYVLPEGKTSIIVNSAIEGMLIRDTEQVFCPSLMFMDENKHVVQDQPLGLHYHRAGWIADPYWFGAAKIPPGAHYIVFYARAEFVGKSVSLAQPSAHREYIDGNGQRVKVSADSTNSLTPCGQVGDLTVLFR